MDSFFNIKQQSTKAPLKQMAKFVLNSACKVSLKNTLEG